MAIEDSSLRAELIRLMDERDRRYKERFEAQENALKLALDGKRQMVANTIAMVSALAAIVIAIIAVFKK